MPKNGGGLVPSPSFAGKAENAQASNPTLAGGGHEAKRFSDTRAQRPHIFYRDLLQETYEVGNIQRLGAKEFIRKSIEHTLERTRVEESLGKTFVEEQDL